MLQRRKVQGWRRTIRNTTLSVPCGGIDAIGTAAGHGTARGTSYDKTAHGMTDEHRFRIEPVSGAVHVVYVIGDRT